MSMGMHAFLSYAHEDLDLLRAVEALSRDGIDVLPASDIQPGQSWVTDLDANIHKSDVFLILLTPRYLQSQICMYDLGLALSEQRDRGAIVIPIIMKDLGETEMPTYLRRFSVIDGRSIGTEELAALLGDAAQRARLAESSVAAT
jgi:hypothetical protein